MDKEELLTKLKAIVIQCDELWELIPENSFFEQHYTFNELYTQLEYLRNGINSIPNQTSPAVGPAALL